MLRMLRVRASIRNIISINRTFCSEPKRFDKILIANRGEIACRVIDTCRRIGIKSVAIFSEADRESLHVKCADEAVCVGPPAPKDSYLNIPKIIEAAKATGAEAIHPGYGFLSQNHNFVTELEANNITFIGPSAKSIQDMSDKVKSKELAKLANVNIIPGYLGEILSESHLVRLLKEMNYPVIIKPVAGEGGKGIRVARNESEALEAFHKAKSEALAAFGDDRILVEKYIDKARHIEIQVLCDSHGNMISLYERECSIQRRHQKLIEEAPSSLIRPRLRKTLQEHALSIAKAAEYTSVGTVEFLVDETVNPPEFYFLEMNTRLQVEHPVTESIVALDLVEEMIHIAAGNSLSVAQEDIPPLGDKWAIECRVYAEDTEKGFLPSAGRISVYEEPSLLDGTIRIDSGIKEGSEISVHYDPLMLKLISVNSDRLQAVDNMKSALDVLHIEGVKHNIGLLRAILSNTRFMSGDINTKFLEEEFPQAGKIKLEEKQLHNLLTVSILLAHEEYRRAFSIHDPDGEEDNEIAFPHEHLVLTYNGKVYYGRYEVEEKKVRLAGDNIEGDVSLEVGYQWGCGSGDMDTLIDGEFTLSKLVKRNYDGFVLQYNSNVHEVKVQTEIENHLSQYMKKEDDVITNQNEFKAPMTGNVLEISVKPGDRVEKRQALFVLEAMKMQNVIRAEKEGVVKQILVNVNDNVSDGDVLLELE